MSEFFFTVFTPTYNRAHTLPRVYESLCAQTYKDFEWLIVDDGSTDNTSKIVEELINLKRIRIRYLRQENAGKHVAFNLGTKNAKGILFLPLDSDDTCVPNALERLSMHWLSIPEELRSDYSGITCLCRDESGAIVGGPLPEDIMDGRFYEVIVKLKRRGEMWGFHKTSVLLEFPFPTVIGEKFVPEGLVWNRIANKYNMRFINEALRYYHNSSDSLSRKMVTIRASSPKSSVTYYIERICLPISALEKFKAGINAWRFILLSKNIYLSKSFFRSHKFIFAASFLPGVIVALKTRIQYIH